MVVSLLPINTLNTNNNITTSYSPDSDDVAPVTLPLLNNKFQKYQQEIKKQPENKIQKAFAKFKAYLYTIGAICGGLVLFTSLGMLGKRPIHREIEAKIKAIYGHNFKAESNSFDHFISLYGGEASLKNNSIHVGFIRLPGTQEKKLAILNPKANGVFSKVNNSERSIFVFENDRKITELNINNIDGVEFYGVPMQLDKNSLKPSIFKGLFDGWKRIFNGKHASPEHSATKTLKASDLIPPSSGFMGDLLSWWGMDALFDLIFTMFI